ncbi:hypothetical protein GCM10022243_50160 [Saccharothrix violaceirubra]
MAGCTPTSSFTTRDTVLMLTPANRATSFIVARRTAPFGDNVVMVDESHTSRQVVSTLRTGRPA